MRSVGHTWQYAARAPWAVYFLVLGLSLNNHVFYSNKAVSLVYFKTIKSPRGKLLSTTPHFLHLDCLHEASPSFLLIQQQWSPVDLGSRGLMIDSTYVQPSGWNSLTKAAIQIKGFILSEEFIKPSISKMKLHLMILRLCSYYLKAQPIHPS